MLANILTYIVIISGALMVITILLQQRGASLGAGFGSSGELFTTRRGVDKSLFDTTVFLAVIFIGAQITALFVS